MFIVAIRMIIFPSNEPSTFWPNCNGYTLYLAVSSTVISDLFFTPFQYPGRPLNTTCVATELLTTEYSIEVHVTAADSKSAVTVVW